MPGKYSPRNYALMLLKIRDRGTEEIKLKMRRKSFSESEIDETIKFLSEKKFIDDDKFARKYLQSQINRAPQGKRRLYAKMKQVYLSNDVINQTLKLIDADKEKDLAAEAASQWLLRNSRLPKEEIKPKLSRYLAGRGFGWDIVGDFINNIE